MRVVRLTHGLLRVVFFSFVLCLALIILVIYFKFLEYFFQQGMQAGVCI
jgi:hypothetical protein